MEHQHKKIIIYNIDDSQTSIVLTGREENVWVNQLRMAELFATSK